MPAIQMTHRPVRTSPLPNTEGKPVILHLGDLIVYDTELYTRLESQFYFVNPPASELQRERFLHHLKNKTWGDFVAIMRPYWNTGGEMKRWDKELIDLLPTSLKVYASAGAGYDWVDTELLAERGILYCNSRGASTEAVADMALYHIISVFRNMTFSHLAARSLSANQFQDAHYNLPERSHNPRDHTLGIVGLGDIGFAIAKKAKLAFGMKILYNDIVRKSHAMEKEVSAKFFHRLTDMVGESDCVLIATPFAGQKIVTTELLSLFKPGARLVNIARGSLVDEDALANALDQGKLTAVGMDVHAGEPHVSARLANNWNVTMTSHTGGGALETIKGFESLSMKNVDAVLNGREPLTAVNSRLIPSARDATGSMQRFGGDEESEMNGHTMNKEHTKDDSRDALIPDGKISKGHATDDVLTGDGQISNLEKGTPSAKP